jgi:hypothetical protein
MVHWCVGGTAGVTRHCWCYRCMEGTAGGTAGVTGVCEILLVLPVCGRYCWWNGLLEVLLVDWEVKGGGDPVGSLGWAALLNELSWKARILLLELGSHHLTCFCCCVVVTASGVGAKEAGGV